MWSSTVIVLARSRKKKSTIMEKELTPNPDQCYSNTTSMIYWIPSDYKRMEQQNKADLMHWEKSYYRKTEWTGRSKSRELSTSQPWRFNSKTPSSSVHSLLTKIQKLQWQTIEDCNRARADASEIELLSLEGLRLYIYIGKARDLQLSSSIEWETVLEKDVIGDDVDQSDSGGESG